MVQEYPELSLVKNEIESEVNAYIDSVVLLSSLREHLKYKGLETHIEQRIDKKNGGYKTPDLLIESISHIIVDHKYTRSKDEKTLSSKITEINEYNCLFVFSSSKQAVGKAAASKPEVVMLTPKEAAENFRKLLNCPITWGYIQDEQIVIEQSYGSVVDPKVSSLFNPALQLPMSKDVAKYRFILSHPPLPYTASQIYSMLWTLIPLGEYFSREFTVKYKDILDVFNTFFPPWIRPEIKQLGPSRLDEALELLQQVGWIRWYESEGIVVVNKSKGRLISDLLAFLIDSYVKIEHERRVRAYQKRIEEPKKGEVFKGQKSITDFL